MNARFTRRTLLRNAALAGMGQVLLRNSRSIGSYEANAALKREYRQGWSL